MKESLILFAVALADLMATLLLVGRNRAVEGNPVMGFYLNIGVGVFIVVKLALIILPIFVVEWSRQYRPRFARNIVRLAIVTYVGLYLVLFLGINVRPIFAKDAETYPISQVQMLK